MVEEKLEWGNGEGKVGSFRICKGNPMHVM